MHTDSGFRQKSLWIYGNAVGNTEQSTGLRTVPPGPALVRREGQKGLGFFWTRLDESTARE